MDIGYEAAAPAGILGLFGAFMGVYLLVMAAVYIYAALALMTIAKKTNTPNPWFAWVPLLNLYLMTQIAGVPAWTILVLLAGFIPIVGSLAILGVTIWWWWKIAEARNKPGWYAILMLVPIVNFIIIGMIAWSD